MDKLFLLKKAFVSLILCFISVSTLADTAKVTPLMQQSLDGLQNKEGVMLIVEYAPGMLSEEHRHDAHIFVYVLEGSITMQVSGAEAVTLGVGDTFYEAPDDIHLVSRNASNTEPAKFLVLSIKEKDAPVVIPIN